jgi:predicted nucleotidyltransferase
MGARVTKRGTGRDDRIAEALFGRTRRNVLGLLFGRPGEAFYLRQIARETGAGTGAAQRELAKLVAADIVLREKRGQSVYFSANPDSPVYDDLRSLLAKTTGIADVLRNAFQTLPDRKRIAVAFLHGSVAEGRQTSDSDIDLVIVGTLPLARLMPALKPIETRLGREINPTIYPPAEFAEKVKGGGHFLRRVLERPRIMLVGTRDDLEKLARESMVDGPRVESRGDRGSPGRR